LSILSHSRNSGTKEGRTTQDPREGKERGSTPGRREKKKRKTDQVSFLEGTKFVGTEQGKSKDKVGITTPSKVGMGETVGKRNDSQQKSRVSDTAREKRQVFLPFYKGGGGRRRSQNFMKLGRPNEGARVYVLLLKLRRIRKKNKKGKGGNLHTASSSHGSLSNGFIATL